MKKFSRTDYSNRIRDQLLKIYTDEEPNITRRPFTDQGWPRHLIFNEDFINYEELEPCIAGFIDKEGSHGLHFLYGGHIGTASPDFNYYYFVPKEKITKIETNLYPFLPHVALSIGGLWSILSDGKRMALLTYSPEFDEIFKLRFPDFSNQVPDFLKHFEYEKNYYNLTDEQYYWIPEMLSHTYGKEKMLLLMQNTNLPRD